MTRICLLVLVTLTALLSGCAKGPLWRTGYISPMARRQWADEERISQTFISKRAELKAMVMRSSDGSPQDQERAARILAELVKNHQVLLMRIEATRLLGELDAPSVEGALRLAARDPDSDVRLTAVSALKKRKGPAALQTLQEMIGSDTDLDVRLSATRALGEFKGQPVEQALSLALIDRNPALQARAVEALEQATGRSLGGNVGEWQKQVAATSPAGKSDGSVQAASAEVTAGEEQFR